MCWPVAAAWAIVTAAAPAVLGVAWWVARRKRARLIRRRAVELYMQQLRGYQPGNITAFRSSTIVVTIKRGPDRYKVLQIGFLKDGTIFVTFPYFKHRTGLLSATTSPGTGQSESMVSLEQGGKVTSHRVKYSHHPTGLALFSQTGKIRSEVRRQSVALESQEGHLFTVLINGLQAFKRAQGGRDEPQISPHRTVITLELPADADAAGTLKIVGRWHEVSRLRFANPVQSIGPSIPTLDPEGQTRLAVALANPVEGTRHVLLLTCDVISRLGADSEMLLFMGGFDSREVVDDTSREAGFLAFIYPAANAADLAQKLGRVDI